MSETKILLVGRGEDCDIQIDDSSISRHHCQAVLKENNKVELVDLNSSNGTTVNLVKVDAPTPISSGDTVRLGSYLWNWESDLARFMTIEKEAVKAVASTENVVSNSQNGSSNNKSLFITMFLSIIVIGIVGGYILNAYVINGEEEVETSTVTDESDDKEGEKDDEEQKDLAENSDDKESEKESASNSNKSNSNSGDMDISAEGVNGTPDQKTHPVVEPGQVDYDFSCLSEADGTGFTEAVDIFSQIENEVVGMVGVEVTPEEEMDYGAKFKDDIEVKNYGSDYEKLQKILKDLVSAIPGGTPYKYEIHLAKGDELNAFTIGAQIFVFEGMIDFCKSDNELAGIIAHEIAHNELGHINEKLVKLKTSNAVLGEDLGALSTGLYSQLTVAFGQKEETHCDLYGIDLAFKAGYYACEVVDVWERMDDNEFSIEESILRSHPFSSQRATCCANHLSNFHPTRCK